MTHKSLREVKRLLKTTRPHRECLLWAPSPSDVLQVDQVWEGEKLGLGGSDVCLVLVPMV